MAMKYVNLCHFVVYGETICINMAPTRVDYKHSHLLSVELQELWNVCKYNVLPASQVSWQFSDIVHCRHVMLYVCVC